MDRDEQLVVLVRLEIGDKARPEDAVQLRKREKSSLIPSALVETFVCDVCNWLAQESGHEQWSART